MLETKNRRPEAGGRGMVADPKKEMEEEFSEGHEHFSSGGRGRHRRGGTNAGGAGEGRGVAVATALLGLGLGGDPSPGLICNHFLLPQGCWGGGAVPERTGRSQGKVWGA